MADSNQPIIIKKIKKGGHGHHGGAWKVAYADFVTAMMAFFLLMWLLNATTEEQKMGLADYFSPSLSTTRTGGGGEGLLGGTSAGTTGVQVTPGSPLLPSIESQPEATPSVDAEDDGSSAHNMDASKDVTDAKAAEQKENKESGGQEVNEYDEDDEYGDSFSRKEYEAQWQSVRQEEAQFESVAAALKAALDNIPSLQELADNLKVEITKEGLRIQLIDQHNYSMFPSGKAEMNDKTKELMELVVTVIQALDNKIAITGHTDAHPFVSKEGYDNWDLSSDRANSTRRFLVSKGVERSRLEKVQGKSDVEPFIKEDPFAPQNRRVSITLLRKNKVPTLPKKSIQKEDAP